MFGARTYMRNPWSIFDELETLQRDFNRMFGDQAETPSRRTGAFPPMNVWSSEEGLVLDVELPGAEPGDVDVRVVGDQLTLTGRTRQDEPGEGATFHRRERACGEFERALQLPFRADANQVTAAYKNGILRIKVPRAESEKPKKIQIEAA